METGENGHVTSSVKGRYNTRILALASRHKASGVRQRIKQWGRLWVDRMRDSTHNNAVTVDDWRSLKFIVWK